MSLDELRSRREYDCRLTPDRALESLDEAHEFLRERGLLTRTADCALPSLYDAWLLPADVPSQLLARGLAIRPAPGWLAAPV